MDNTEKEILTLYNIIGDLETQIIMLRNMLAESANNEDAVVRRLGNKREFLAIKKEKMLEYAKKSPLLDQKINKKTNPR